jgi:hypothetical protein
MAPRSISNGVLAVAWSRSLTKLEIALSWCHNFGQYWASSAAGKEQVVIKQALLFASFCFMGSQAFAGPIPTLAATSVDISTVMAGAEHDSISASGPSFTLGAATSLPGINRLFIPIGVPAPVTVFDLPRCCMGLGFLDQTVGGMVTIGEVPP